MRWPGVAVSVRVPAAGAADAHGNPSASWGEPVEVAGVLPYPSGTGDLGEERPDGVTVAMRFHWPRADHRDLRGALVGYGGRTYRVVGDPQPYPDGSVPGPWDRTVETEACDG